MCVLFIGFHHRINDPRLFHRQMRVLKSCDNSFEFYFMTPLKIYAVQDVFKGSLPEESNYKKISRHKLRIAIIKQIPELRQLRPSVIQASDVRELHWAILFRFLTGARIIYDSHEDYFNQVFEYSGKTVSSFFLALIIFLMEFIFLRFFDVVFCTDEYLFHKYSNFIYGCRSVKLLRNFPPTSSIAENSAYEKKLKLNLVYIGSVNQYRGVIECAEYVACFNQMHGPVRELTFTVYSSGNNPIIDDLVERNMVRHFPWIDYSELIRVLPNYDIGICLWHQLKKFERNLPIKNFDYMAAGLPIITSNFGNLQKYAQLAGNAYCINPAEYKGFEEAVIELFDPIKRRELGKKGQAFIFSQASFEDEATEYVKYMKQVSTK